MTRVLTFSSYVNAVNNKHVSIAGSVLSFFIPKEPYSEKSPASATYRKQNHEVYVIT